MILRFLLLAAGTTAALSFPAIRDAQGTAPTRPAVQRHTLADTIPMYTAEQLTSGTALYEKLCRDCHEDADYTNEKFRTKWNGRTLYDLYEDIRTKMPEDNPNSLTRDQYAEAMAYVLKLNGVPAGPNRVAPNDSAMKAITLKFGAQ